MEILGLLEALDSMISDAFRIPLTRKVILDEDKIHSMIDKIRLVVESGEGFVKEAISTERRAVPVKEEPAEVKKITETVRGVLPPEMAPAEIQGKAIEIIQQAYQLAGEIRRGADKYADEVLSNLEVTSSRVLRAIRNGRLKLSKVIEQNGSKSPVTEKEDIS